MGCSPSLYVPMSSLFHIFLRGVSPPGRILTKKQKKYIIAMFSTSNDETPCYFMLFMLLLRGVAENLAILCIFCLFCFLEPDFGRGGVGAVRNLTENQITHKIARFSASNDQAHCYVLLFLIRRWSNTLLCSAFSAFWGRVLAVPPPPPPVQISVPTPEEQTQNTHKLAMCSATPRSEKSENQKLMVIWLRRPWCFMHVLLFGEISGLGLPLPAQSSVPKSIANRNNIKW